MKDLSFEAIDNKETISTFETAWRNSLTFPYDSSDETKFDRSQHWVLKLEKKMIGYASVSSKNILFNFYITPKYLMYGTVVLEEFIKQRAIKKAEVTTNNPICLSMIMHFQKSIEMDSYLFKDMEDINQEERDVEFKLAEPDDLEGLVDFNISAHGYKDKSEASRGKLRNYCGASIRKGEVFIILKKNTIIGLLEAITFNKGTNLTSLGVVVLPEYRNQGYGSYLFGKGKSLAKSRDSEAICNCDHDNISSRKALEKSGFRILHLTLLINL